MLTTHSTRLERWLGASNVEHVSQAMANWYGPPIAVAGVPGEVYATGDGDFIGQIRAGWEATWEDRARDLMHRLRRGIRTASYSSKSTLHSLSSVADIISKATAGKSRTFSFNKVGPTGVADVTSTLWRVGPQPSAGSTPGGPPAGRQVDQTIVGAFPYTLPVSPDQQFFVSAFVLGSVAGNTLLLYDRIFDIAPNMNSSATQAVTGVPLRYQNTTGGNPDSIDGNFLFFEVGGTALAATAHNWTVCSYNDQTGAAGAVPLLTGNASAIVDRLDHPNNQWFAPLAVGDTGIKALTQLQLSAAVATGVCNAVIGHPLAWIPVPIASMALTIDGVMTAFQLQRIFDNAALSFLEVVKPSTTATTYTGTFTTVSG